MEDQSLWASKIFKETKHPKIRSMETWWMQPAVDKRGQEELCPQCENFSERLEDEAGGGDPSSASAHCPSRQPAF